MNNFCLKLPVVDFLFYFFDTLYLIDNKDESISRVINETIEWLYNIFNDDDDDDDDDND